MKTDVIILAVVTFITIQSSYGSWVCEKGSDCPKSYCCVNVNNHQTCMRRPGLVRPCHPYAELQDEDNEIYESGCLCSKGTTCQLIKRSRRNQYKCKKDKGKQLTSTTKTTRIESSEPPEIIEPTTTIEPAEPPEVIEPTTTMEPAEPPEEPEPTDIIDDDNLEPEIEERPAEVL